MISFEHFFLGSSFSRMAICAIHKVTISWPKFPAPRSGGSRGRMKRVTSKGCENIENCLHVLNHEGSGYKWICGSERHHKEIYIVWTWHLLWILRLALTGICMASCPHHSWGKYWNWWQWNCSKISFKTETMVVCSQLVMHLVPWLTYRHIVQKFNVSRKEQSQLVDLWCGTNQQFIVITNVCFQKIYC